MEGIVGNDLFGLKKRYKREKERGEKMSTEKEMRNRVYFACNCCGVEIAKHSYFFQLVWTSLYSLFIWKLM